MCVNGQTFVSDEIQKNKILNFEKRKGFLLSLFHSGVVSNRNVSNELLVNILKRRKSRFRWWIALSTETFDNHCRWYATIKGLLFPESILMNRFFELECPARAIFLRCFFFGQTKFDSLRACNIQIPYVVVGNIVNLYFFTISSTCLITLNVHNTISITPTGQYSYQLTK